MNIFVNYFYDENKIRYTLSKTNGGKTLNWLFFPGGPGCDSKYFLPLVENLKAPGNMWLIDLPGNASNNVEDIQSYSFDNWFDLFIPMVKKFDHPILVGHSFGGMFALLHPELESILKGFVIMNSSPKLWLNEAVEFAKKHNLPNLTNEMLEFTQNPNETTFKLAVNACAPYYFTKGFLEKGKEFLDSIPFSYQTAVWWQRKAIEIGYHAKWIPETLKTLIVGSEYDGITPWELFNKDKKFDRKNIKKVLIENAGHIPWFEQLEKTCEVIEFFSNQSI